MHELAIAESIIEIAVEAAGEAKVTRVVVEVGKLAAVVPSALRFCFDLASQDTPVAGAELALVELPGHARCRRCGAELTLDVAWGQCACGSGELDWLGGSELRVKSIEVA